jgi:hypothetical protein
LRRLLLLVAILPLLLIDIVPQTAAVSAASGFSFNWTGLPAAPQPWVPGPVNDWDLFSNIDGPTDLNGAMNAGHGTDCGPPPATHPVRTLAESVYLCKNHMMTAVSGSTDAYTTYGSVYFTPAQMVDWSAGQASVSWKVSTERLSSRDWWQVNLSPYTENLVMPTELGDVAYQGLPDTGLEMRIDNTECGNGQQFGSFIRVFKVSGGGTDDITQQMPCVETTVPPSFATRSQFQIDISQNHLRVYMPGTTTVWYDGPISLPFNQAVVQFSHHSYNPAKGENPDGTQGQANTYHWSDVAISPSRPFTMLRPVQPFSLHDGQDPVLALPQPAPKNASLRFAAVGDIQISTDGGKTYQPARMQGTQAHLEHMTTFFTPIPQGTTTVMLRGQTNSSEQPWWVEDVNVWASDAVAPLVQPARAAAAPSPGPSASPAPAASPAAGWVNPHEGARGGPEWVGPISAVANTGSSGFLAVAGRVPAAFWPGVLTGGLLAVAAVLALAVVRRRRVGVRAGPPRGGPPAPPAPPAT